MPVLYRNKKTIDNLRPRIKGDVYTTSYELALATVDFVGDLCFYNHNPIMVLDPGAGNGVWGEAIRRTYFDSQVTGVDIRRMRKHPSYKTWVPRKDFLNWTPDLEFDFIIGNPPFNLAEKFILHSRELLSEKGILCFLLPSQFQHGQRRGRELFRDYTPEYIVSLLQRPNFTGPKNESLGNANTDDYILMIWGKDSNANPPKHLFLDWKTE